MSTVSPVSPDSSLPAWWQKAILLEAENRLDEAEAMIRDGCPYLAFAYPTADLYRQRMVRLQATGDRAGALAAFQKSRGFIYFYASSATSGGEGTALSAERDEFYAQLVALYEGDVSDAIPQGI
jgi:hypothetical protein